MHLSTGFFDWGLKLPSFPVSRRIIRNLDIRGRVVLGELQGPGCVRRFQITGRHIGRELILRIYFDGREAPNVETPLADFFGLMHNMSEMSDSPYRKGHPDRASYRINTPFLISNPHNAFTTYFPMPFAESARFEVINDADQPSHLFYYIDWHEYSDQTLEEPMRFCARWRREAPVPDSQDDFLMLDADGPGRLVGYVHSIDMLHDRHIMRWSHAGSDNAYIDGAGQRPAYFRGHGAEDTFGASYGGHTYPAQTSLFSDIPFYLQKNEHHGDCLRHTDRQKLVGYRFFAHEAVCFNDSIHLRFGARGHDLAATVYWYAVPSVRPFAQMPPYEERLPDRKPGRRYDLDLPDSGRWWVCGPFPMPFEGKLSAFRDFDASQPFRERLWREYAARRGFVDFNHVFRPSPSNANTATLTAAAVARCEVYTPHACRAKIRFGWDDALTFCLNDGEAQALGHHDYFQSREVSAHLEAGANRLVVLLTNTTGLSRGAWNFSCGITAETGEALVPAIRYASPAPAGGPLLSLGFRAGAATALLDRVLFIPPYSADPEGADPGDCLDLICSPQTMVFGSPVGPLAVTVSTSDNTSLGFRRRTAVEKGPFADQSELVRGEVRANPGPKGEPVRLELALRGLPSGEYALTSYHHCHVDGEKLGALRVEIQGRRAFEKPRPQSAGCNPDHIADLSVIFRSGNENEPTRIAYESETAVVMNGFELKALDNARFRAGC